MISFSLEYKLIHDLVSTIWFSGMPDIMVWPKIILAIALWVKCKMATITASLSYINYHPFRQNRQQKHNFDVYHRVFRYSRHNVWLESTLDIALWVKSKMAAICEIKIKCNCQQNGRRFVILVPPM